MIPFMAIRKASAMDENQHIPESEASKIREFLFAGRKIEAIKLLREVSGLGLAEAKTVVEKLEGELRQSSPEKFTGRAKGCGTAVVCCLLFVGCCAWLVSGAWGASRAGPYLKRDDAWNAGDAGRRVAGNILTWQSEEGRWPKYVDTADAP